MGYNGVVKASDEVVASLMQPLIPWLMGHTVGRFWGRATALSMGKPTLGVRKASWEEFGRYLPAEQLTAFRRSCIRKRWRRFAKKALIPYLRTPEMQELRLSFQTWVEKLVAAGYRGECKSIHKLDQVEQEMIKGVWAQEPGAVKEAFPPNKVLDPRRYRAVMEELGDSYPVEVAATIQEAALGIRPEELRKAPMGRVPPSLSKLTTISSVSELMDELVCFFGLGELVGRPESEAERDKRFREAALWRLRRVLARRLGIHRKPPPEPESAPGPSFVQEVDLRCDLETWLEHLPAAQREAVELLREADGTGASLKEVCRRKGKDYNAVSQALHRLRRKPPPT